MPYKNPHYHRDYFRAQGEKRRAYLRERYHKNPSKQRAAERRYRASPQGQAAQHINNQSPRAIAARKIWREDNPEKVAAAQFRWRLKKHGVDVDWYLRQLELQDFCCQICLAPFPTDGLKHVQVDHDHQTGLVRGLLCKGCNNGLGCFKDAPSNLERAILYLKQYA